VEPVTPPPTVVLTQVDIDSYYTDQNSPPSFNPKLMQTPTPPPLLVPSPKEDLVRNDIRPVDSDGNTMFRDSPSPSASIPYGEWKYPIDEAIGKSLFFYEVQRSGFPAGDSRVSWRGDSPKRSDGEFSGGWYDAGDHVKFGLPLTYSAGRLALMVVHYRETLRGTYFDGQTNLHWALRELEWIADYIRRCHPDKDTFVAQVGDGDIDHSYLGRAETLDTPRPVFKLTKQKPGPDLTASAAGAMAACAVAFKGENESVSVLCLNAALSLWAMTFSNQDALDNGITYDQSIPEASKFYRSSGINHHITFAATMLFKATGDLKYRDEALFYAMAPDVKAPYGPFKYYSIWASWDNAWFEAACTLLMDGHDTQKGDLRKLVDSMMMSWINAEQGVKITPGGAHWLSPWGSNRYAANSAGIAVLAARAIPEKADIFNKYAASQLHYIWGDTGRSYVVGFGKDPPLRPHHRNSACTLQESLVDSCAAAWTNKRANPNVLHGALVGGPSKPNDKYNDDRGDYIESEVAIDYNACYTLASAGLASLDRAFWEQLPQSMRSNAARLST
jgi:hypothetical protein